MFTRLMDAILKPFSFNSTEYCERFIVPLQQRAAELGIPDDEFDLMWKAARKEAEPWIVGRAPGSLLRNLIDNWERDRAGLIEFLRENYGR